MRLRLRPGANRLDPARKLALTLAATASLLGMALCAQATTWFVNVNTGSNANLGTSSGSAFKTIQKAIDVAAASGDTVKVAAGFYFEHLAWSNKSLALLGAGSSSTFIDG